MITEDGAKVPAPVKAAVVVNQAKKEDDNAESPAEHKIEELLKPQTIIRGALLVTKEEASANQRGPYLGSDRERIAKDILDFAQQQIDANYDLLPKDADKKINQEVRQGYINNGKVPITILTRDVTNISYE